MRSPGVLPSILERQGHGADHYQQRYSSEGKVGVLAHGLWVPSLTILVKIIHLKSHSLCPGQGWKHITRISLKPSGESFVPFYR